MKYPAWLWPAIIIGSAAGAGIVTFGALGPPLRPAMSLWFLLIGPGMAWVRLLRLQEGFVEWTLAVALSLALDTIVAEIMVYSGAWSPPGSLAVLIGLSVAGALIQIATAYGRRAGEEKQE